MSDVTTMCKHKIRVWDPVPWSIFGPSPPTKLISALNTFVWGSREGHTPSFLFFDLVFSSFEGVLIKYLTFGYKIRIEDACSSSGILEGFLTTGKGFFRVISEMLVGLMNLKK